MTMNIIAYNQRPAELGKLQNQLAKNGFNVLGATNSMRRLCDIVGEYDGSVAILSPEILGFMETKDEIKNCSKPDLGPSATLNSSLKVFTDKGHWPLISHELWRAAVQLANERYETGLASVHAGIYLQEHCLCLPRGYEELPAVWHVALPGLLKFLLSSIWRGNEVAFIEKLEVRDGILDVGFFCEDILDDPDIRKLRDITRVFLNRHLYPSRWVPLLAQHQVELYNERMDLREEIERVHENK
jgi:hypothetical protein